MTADRSKTGVIFNIQKYSVNDGPGIRSTVFFKGCPLRCRWCSNPESQEIKEEILWSEKSCLRCQHCVKNCPVSAISLNNNRIHIDKNKCTLCGNCYSECPAHSLEKAGRKVCVQEVITDVLRDLPFYEESGGGITLSGGEVFMQHEFAMELLKAAREEGLHTCIETTGSCSTDIFNELLTYVDFLLIDMKHYDSENHRLFTGMDNNQIIKNIADAIISGKNMLIRIPVIPGFNDSLDDALHFTEKLHSVGADRCQLLPFHQFGENKYNQLNRAYDYTDVNALHREELEEYINIFRENGIEAFF